MLIAASTALLASVDLPLHGPVPVARPDIAEPSAEKAEPPGDQPVHEGNRAGEAEDPAAGETRERQEEAYDPPPIEKDDPVLFTACTAELKAMGAAFSETGRIDDGGGCGIDRPIEVKTLGSGIVLAPPGTLRCQAAVNLARWTRDVVIPMLGQAQPKETLAAVNQASAYVCRKRNGADTGKISEHAHGNAIDIAGFTFESGRTFTIAPREADSTLNGAFQRAIASAACLYFSTVLDPGSDKAHETHLHLDTMKRRGGYRYCW